MGNVFATKLPKCASHLTKTVQFLFHVIKFPQHLPTTSITKPHFTDLKLVFST